MMKTMTAIGAAVLLSTMVASAAPRASGGACAADIKAKCAGVQPGEGRIVACVKEHLAEFSEPCQARLANVAAVAKACAADVKQNCAGKTRRRGAIAACIRGLLGNLSDACKGALGEAVAGRK